MPSGQIIILNGAPRAGKSSIAREIQQTFDGVWMNLGVDAYVREITPEHLRPGIGLRPGGERPDLEPLIPTMYGALYDSIAVHSRAGLNIVADFGHHGNYATIANPLFDCARRLAGLPVLFVGVRCDIGVIMARRNAGQAGRHGYYETSTPEVAVPEPVALFQTEVHKPGIYDLEVDTTSTTSTECAATIRRHLGAPRTRSTAFDRLASM